MTKRSDSAAQRAAKLRRAAEAEAAEAAERLRRSQAYQAASDRAGQLRAAARDRWQASGADERLDALADRVRDSAAVAAADAAVADAAGAARDRSERLLDRFGAWLSEGGRGQRLGLSRPPRRLPAWLLLGAGLAAGYAVGAMLSGRRRDDLRRDLNAHLELTANSEGAGGGGRPGKPESDSLSYSAPPSLEDQVRSAIATDPRTDFLSGLNVNVVASTVFIRGLVPDGYDPDGLRAVVTEIDGVNDVDLQVTAR